MNIRKRRGSMMVETAIFLPIFILALLTIAHLIRVVQVQETLMSVLSMQGRRMITEEYVKRQLREEVVTQSMGKSVLSVEVGNKAVAQWQVRTILEQELGSWIFDVALDACSSGASEDGLDALCRMGIRGKVTAPMAKLFHQEIHLREQVVCRGFVGRSESLGVPFSLERMEREEAARPVYVFPRAGERYHKVTCHVVRSTPHRMLLTGKLKKQKEGCGCCHAELLSEGTPVLCFSSANTAYHRMDCKTARKYVQCMELEQAKAEGYTPCLLCGGE